MSEGEIFRLWHTLKFLAGILGLETNKTYPSGTIEVSADMTIKSDSPMIDATSIADLIEQRRLARKAKNFQESDRIRDYLKSLGVVLVDQPDGTTRWLRESP
jgi:cysteinyl-tRNA synthetase